MNETNIVVDAHILISFVNGEGIIEQSRYFTKWFLILGGMNTR